MALSHPSPQPLRSPADLRALVIRCLEKDPAARPQSAREIAAALDGLTTATADASRLATVGQRGRPRRWVTDVIALGVVGAAAGVAMFITRAPSSAHATDPALIAVVPFRVASADPSLRYLREGMVDLIAAKLVRTPRTVDQRTALAAWRRAGGSQTDDLARADEVRMARELRAGRLIEGDVVGAADRLTLSATLVAVPNGDERGRASATGPASALAVLVDSVIAKLLARDAGEPDQRAASLASTPIAALEAYLAGQAHYRAGRYAEAAVRFADAIAIDSTFALAGLALSSAASWTVDPRGARGHEIAILHADKLGTRDRLALGTIDPDSAYTTYAEAIARSERALSVAPDSPELWCQFADRQFHYGPGMVGPDEAGRRAIAALERGISLDPSFTPLLEHMPILYEAAGDTARARLAIEHFMRDTAALYYPATRVFYAPDSVARAQAVRDLTTRAPFLAGYAVAVSSATGWDVSFADELLRDVRARAATEQDRSAIAYAEYLRAADGGQPTRALRAAADLPLRRAERMFAATFWDGDSTAGAAQYAETKPLLTAPPPTDASDRRAWVTALFDLAQYELAHGDTTHAGRVIGQLRQLPRVPGNPVESARPSRLALVLDAQLAARAGRPDARQCLESLDSLLRLAPLGLHVRAAGNLVASRLWERAGDLRRAYEAAQRWTPTTGPTEGVLLSTHLREQGRLAAALGEREAAIRAYRRYMKLRPNPEPALKADVAAVRAELERLERQTAGR